MDRKTKLSIITINFNDKSGLQETVGSVVNQTFNDIEYILIDGGSTDGSVEVIKEYDKRINYWVSEPDNGIYDAMNKGIAKATGEYCLFLNSGDCLVDYDVLQKLFANNFNEDIIYGNLRCKLENGKYDEIFFPDNVTFLQLFSAYLPHPCTLIKRNYFETFGNYDEKYTIVADWALMTKAIGKYNCTTRHVPVMVSCHALGGVSSQVQFQQKNYDERQDFLKTEFPAFYDDYIRLISLDLPNDRSTLRSFLLSFSKKVKNVFR